MANTQKNKQTKSKQVKELNHSNNDSKNEWLFLRDVFGEFGRPGFTHFKVCYPDNPPHEYLVHRDEDGWILAFAECDLSQDGCLRILLDKAYTQEDVCSDTLNKAETIWKMDEDKPVSIVLVDLDS